MRRHVHAHLRGDLRVVDALLLAVVAQVGHADELDATAERVVVRVLLERVEVQLVGAGHHHGVDRQRGEGERDLACLDREQQVLPGVERALEQVAVLEQAARGVDQLAVRLEQRERAERRGQRVERRVGGDLALAGVDRHLRADGDGARAVAARDRVALDLHVREHARAGRRGRP